MGESSIFKDRLRKARVVHLWFWDGEREYDGEAVTLAPDGATALLKMTQTGEETVVPTRYLVDDLKHRLQGKLFDVKLGSQGLNADVRARIEEVQTDFEQPRRILLTARFESPSDRSRTAIARLQEFLAGR